MPLAELPRGWTRQDLELAPEPQFYRFTPDALEQIEAAVEALRLRNMRLEIMEAEDFRVPAFSRDVPMLRERLDRGYGFVVLRGLDISGFDRDEVDMIYWGIGNYLGRVMRQNLRGERLDRVRNLGEDNVTDPYRLIETPVFFQPHTDNGMLEPRPPNYLGLMCLNSAKSGGESLLVSAYTLHNVIAEERPQYMERLYRPFHIDPPVEQRLPNGSPTFVKPVFQWDGADLIIHYIRYLMDPGMEKAGTPLTAEEREILDYTDTVIRREELQFQYKLEPGEILFNNNNTSLHGRKAFVDHDGPGQGRELRRIWLWRRHGWPGADPVTLDDKELGSVTPN